MHDYLRAIGFSNIKDTYSNSKLIGTVVEYADRRMQTTAGDSLLTSYSKEFGEDIGLTVVGWENEDGKFVYEYSYPYLKSDIVSIKEDVIIEKHKAYESYSGVCEDAKIGITVIFYLQNIVPYVRALDLNSLPQGDTSIYFSALSTEGTILMPLQKNEASRQKDEKIKKKRIKLLEQARNGNEDAMESLTLNDMDTYTALYKKLQTTDIYTLVDTYFMPYGIECDLYSLMGEIKDIKTVKNIITDEIIYKFILDCNDIIIKVCINQKDLYGEPQVGRRFKGVIWLQGCVDNINV